jgi:hypothetical protein
MPDGTDVDRVVAELMNRERRYVSRQLICDGFS